MSQMHISNEHVLADFKEMLGDCADLINQFSTIKETHFDALKEVTRDVCEVDLSYQKAMTALNKTKSHCSEDAANMKSVYEDFLRAEGEISKVEEHKLYLVIEKKSIPYDNDKSVICSGTKQSVLDPISKLPIKVPCRNNKCNHLYDYDTISMYISSRAKQPNTRAPCPYIGCKNDKVLQSDLDKSQKVQDEFTMMMESQHDNTRNSIINISL